MISQRVGAFPQSLTDLRPSFQTMPVFSTAPATASRSVREAGTSWRSMAVNVNAAKREVDGASDTETSVKRVCMPFTAPTSTFAAGTSSRKQPQIHKSGDSPRPAARNEFRTAQPGFLPEHHGGCVRGGERLCAVAAAMAKPSPGAPLHSAPYGCLPTKSID